MSHQLLRPRRGMNTPTVNSRQVADMLSHHGYFNLGITYSGSTFSITAADGSALSATNSAWVCLPSKTAGRQVWVQVTANQTFVDDTGSSTIAGNLFGLTTGIAHADAIPFFIYAVLNDSENAVSFMISRYPFTRVSPASANIGKTGSAIADTQGSFFALSDPTVTDYDANPCLLVGSFRMTMSSSDDWTVVTLTGADGIGLFQRGIGFQVSKGQFGAASGKWFLDNGGTAPDDSAGGYSYLIDTYNNMIKYIVAFPSVTTAGVGAVAAQMAIPFKSAQGISAAGSGTSNVAGVGVRLLLPQTGATGTQTLVFSYTDSATSGVQLNSAFVALSTFYVTGTYTPQFA